MPQEPLLPPHGGYRNLKSFQVAQLCYDLTVRFCDKYIDRRSRTHDQMVQAARSGVQNIAEGSQFSGTSRKMEIKLTNIARGSLEELKLDYEDYLRHRRLDKWEKKDPRRQHLIDQRCQTVDEVVRWVKQVGLAGLGGRSGPGGENPTEATDEGPNYAQIAANTALTLLAVACALLDRQIASQAAALEKEGGFTERLYRVRKSNRGY